MNQKICDDHIRILICVHQGFQRGKTNHRFFLPVQSLRDKNSLVIFSISLVSLTIVYDHFYMVQGFHFANVCVFSLQVLFTWHDGVVG